MPSAEQHLKDAWKHVAPAPHDQHELAQPLGIENHAVDEQSKQKLPHDPVHRAKCSCGDILRILVQDVYEHTMGDASKPADAPKL